jgi:hypothetical protein
VLASYDYAVIRVVPRVERGEQINVGVIVSCPTCEYLEAAIALDPARLLALDPTIDVADVEAALAVIPWIAAGDPRGGPVAPVHTGLCTEPSDVLAQLLARLVR